MDRVNPRSQAERSSGTETSAHPDPFRWLVRRDDYVHERSAFRRVFRRRVQGCAHLALTSASPRRKCALPQLSLQSQPRD